MERVVGIGGVFCQAKDAEALRAWYAEHLGIDVQDWAAPAWRALRLGDGSRGEPVRALAASPEG